MKVTGWIAIAFLLFGASAAAEPIGTDFSYQGVLTDDGQPANGLYDFELDLFDNPIISTPLSTRRFSGVSVFDGRFTLRPDFGDEFFGDRRWIGIRARRSGAERFTQLEPLQEITPAPHAWHAENVGFGAVAGPQLADGAVTARKIDTAAVTDAALAAGAVTRLKLAAGAVTTAALADRSVTTAKLSAGAVDSAQIADGAVTAAKIARGAVGSGHIAGGAVGATALADGAVTTPKLPDGAVTLPKISPAGATDGDVMTYDSGTGTILWAAPSGDGLSLPFFGSVETTGPGLSVDNNLGATNASAIRAEATPPGRALHVTNSGTGLRIDDASSIGVHVGTSGGSGLVVQSAAAAGVAVGSAGGDGVQIGTAGAPSASNGSVGNDGVEVQGAEGHGLWVGHADGDGVHINSAAGDGLHVAVAAGDGIHVAAAGSRAALLEGNVEVTGLLSTGNISSSGTISATSDISTTGNISGGLVSASQVNSTDGLTTADNIIAGTSISAGTSMTAGSFVEAVQFQYDAPKSRYASVPPTAFRPRSEGQELISTSVFATSPTTEAGTLFAAVQLPDFAVVTRVRFRIEDTCDVCDLTMRLVRVDFQGNREVMAEKTSGAAEVPGFATLAETTVAANQIGNQAYTYSLEAESSRWIRGGICCSLERVEIRGVTIDYTVIQPD